MQMKNIAYFLYILGIIIFSICIETYQSKGLGDITILFFYAGLIISFIGLVASFFSPKSFGPIKKIMFGMTIGILSLTALVAAVHFFDN